MPAGLRQEGWGVGTPGRNRCRAERNVREKLGVRLGVDAELALVLLDREREIVIAPRKLDVGLPSLECLGDVARRTLLFRATEEIESV